MALTLKKKAPLATISVEHKESGKTVTEQLEQEEVAPPQGEALLPDPHATVQVSTSLTINLGHYNSVKVGVSIALPAALHELDEVFQYGRDWMNAKMEQLAADVAPDGPAEG